MQAARIQLGDMAIKVAFKDIKNVHLSVHPPGGRISISAPRHMNPDSVRVFAISKLDWIKRQRKRIQEQDREPPREFIDRESHYVWGKRYLLAVVERNEPSVVELKHSRLMLLVRPGTNRKKREAFVAAWHRDLIRQATPEIIARWEPRMGVAVDHVYVQRMKTRWGTCNPTSRSIRLNTDLARKPRECLEYIVVHEMCHMLEPTHNERFVALMDRFMPRWHTYRNMLNRLPVRHENWEY